VEGTVTFGTTKESLHEGLGDPANSFHLGEDMLLMTRFSRKIKDFCTRNTDPVCSRLFPLELHVTDNGKNVGHSDPALPDPSENIQGWRTSKTSME
jgi:hypothetical protein